MFANVTNAAKVGRIDADLPRTGMLNNEWLTIALKLCATWPCYWGLPWNAASLPGRRAWRQCRRALIEAVSL